MKHNEPHLKKRSTGRTVRQLATAFMATAINLTTAGAAFTEYQLLKMAQEKRLRLQSTLHELSLRDTSLTTRAIEITGIISSIAMNPKTYNVEEHKALNTEKFIAEILAPYLQDSQLPDKLLKPIAAPNAIPRIPEETLEFLNKEVKPSITFRDFVRKKGFIQPGGQYISVKIDGETTNIHVELAALELIAEVGNNKQCFIHGWVRNPVGFPVLVTIPDHPDGSFYACLKIGLYGTKFDQLETRKPPATSILHPLIKGAIDRGLQKQLDRLPRNTAVILVQKLKAAFPAYQLTVPTVRAKPLPESTPR